MDAMQLFGRRRRSADSYRPDTPHPFMPIRDVGIAMFGLGGGGTGRAPNPFSAVVTTDNYLRKSGCAVPGCGKPADDPIHAPAD